MNISEEVPSSALPGRALDVFKCVTGRDRIDLERKGSQPFCGIITTKLLFAGNTLPTFVKVDGSDALTERMHILRFEYGVVEEECDNGLEDRVWEERDSIVQYALQALAQFVRRNMTFRRKISGRVKNRKYFRIFQKWKIMTQKRKEMLETLEQMEHQIAKRFRIGLKLRSSFQLRIYAQRRR